MSNGDQTRDPGTTTARHISGAAPTRPEVDGRTTASGRDADATRGGTPGEATVPAAPPVPTIPGYQILEEIGHGGMGVVYRARQVSLNREVALKTILRADLPHFVVARFWAEAEVMAAVKHPNVVQVIELGESGGRPFMAMEYVAGGSLAGRLLSGPLPPHTAAELVEKVARGVAAAHALAVVHRDLKPGNVLIAADGTPKVADFGIAKWRSTELTATQAWMGTPAYMAPEQAAGRAKFVGSQADVWALGVILYECVAGKRPFEADTAEALLSQIRSAEPVSLRKRARGVTRDLDTIAAKCLAKEPEHRYPTAAELADDLGRFLCGEPIGARPVAGVERLVRWARRKPTAAAAWVFSALAVLLAAVVFVIAGLWRKAESARDEAISLRDIANEANDKLTLEKKRAEDARAGEEVAKREAEYRNYAHAVDLGHREYKANDLARARELLDGCSSHLRHWEWYYVHRLCHADLFTLTVGTGEVASAAFSGDGRRVLAASSDGTAWVWDAESGQRLAVLRGHVGEDDSAALWGDGRRVVTASRDGTVRVWDAATGRGLAVLRGHAGEVTSLTLSEDGERVVTGSRNGTARIWDVESGQQLATLKGYADEIDSLPLSGDGRPVLAALSDRTIRVGDTTAGVIDALGHLGEVTSVMFSGDGRRVVTASRDGTVRVWDATTGRGLVLLRGHLGEVTSAALSGDGRRVVTASRDGTVRVWDAEGGQQLAALNGHADPVNILSVALSGDGRRVVTASRDGTVRVWDATTGKQLLTLPGHTGPILTARFSTDGTRILTAGTDGAVTRVIVYNARPVNREFLLREIAPPPRPVGK